MPRYRYVCSECQDEQIVFHLYDEKLDLVCPVIECEGGLARSLTTPAIINKKEVESSTGELTEEFIEESKEALKQQKLEAKESTYEPS
tara:strand:+ start:281 stop:544 length:264 start_codon:yes stop_codon:yes gene_type:complete